MVNVQLREYRFRLLLDHDVYRSRLGVKGHFIAFNYISYCESLSVLTRWSMTTPNEVGASVLVPSTQ